MNFKELQKKYREAKKKAIHYKKVATKKIEKFEHSKRGKALKRLGKKTIKAYKKLDKAGNRAGNGYADLLGGSGKRKGGEGFW